MWLVKGPSGARGLSAVRLSGLINHLRIFIWMQKSIEFHLPYHEILRLSLRYPTHYLKLSNFKLSKTHVSVLPLPPVTIILSWYWAVQWEDFDLGNEGPVIRLDFPFGPGENSLNSHVSLLRKEIGNKNIHTWKHL